MTNKIIHRNNLIIVIFGMILSCSCTPETRYIREYYSDGSIKLEYTMVDGKKEGLEKEFYKSGKVKRTSSFVNGIENGTMRVYFENGNIKMCCFVSCGMLNGKVTHYAYNGNVRLINYYYNSKEYGLGEYYDTITGNLNFVRLVYDDVIISENPIQGDSSPYITIIRRDSFAEIFMVNKPNNEYSTLTIGTIDSVLQVADTVKHMVTNEQLFVITKPNSDVFTEGIVRIRKHFTGLDTIFYQNFVFRISWQDSVRCDNFNFADSDKSK